MQIVSMPQDYAQARHWYEKAAAQGDPDARYNLVITVAFSKLLFFQLFQSINSICFAFFCYLKFSDVAVSIPLKAPRGGTPPATPLREHLAHHCQDMEAQAFEADVL